MTSPQMMTDVDSGLDDIVSSYYSDQPFSAIIQVKVDAKHVDATAEALAERDEVIDLFLVMGDTDFVAKVRVDTYQQLRDFLVGIGAEIEGITETSTLNVVTTYKEIGRKVP